MSTRWKIARWWRELDDLTRLSYLCIPVIAVMWAVLFFLIWDWRK